jgi:PIN domain nuclease of toxin-antitoxin system
VRVVLDTCAWVWYVAGDPRLSRRAREAIGARPDVDSLVVSVFSCWEVAKLVEKGKLGFSLPLREWIQAACRQPGVTLQELTPDICVDSTQLPGHFHGDPADQLLVATARRLNLPIVTSDQRIRDYPHVGTIW